MKCPSYGARLSKHLLLNSNEGGVTQGQGSPGDRLGKNMEQSVPKTVGKVLRDRILMIAKWVNLNLLAQKSWEQYRSIVFLTNSGQKWHV